MEGQIMTVVRVVLLCLFSSACWAQSPAEKVEAFLTQFGAGQSDQALDKLLEGSSMARGKPQMLIAMKSQVKTLLDIYGKPIGFEKMREADFSPSLKRVTYLQKFDQNPVIWEVYFYKAKSAWTVSYVVFNDQLGILLGGRQ
jgi:hypothetical protein